MWRPLNSGICLLDICSGSGAVALALLDERPYLKITASDISAAALVVLKQNYERLLQKQTADIKMQPLTIIESDLFSMIHKKYTIIVANPPYIKSKDIDSLPKEIQQEPRLALDGGEDGLVLIKKIIINAKRYLETSGALFIEAAPDQMYDIAALLANAGYKNIVIKNDLNNLQRVIGAER